MNEETLLKVEKSIENLRDKSSRIYFMVQDTKGNPKAGVRMSYQMAQTLKEEGYNTFIMHEKNDYTGVSSWMGEKYMEITHSSIENQNLQISPEDFIIIPEVYGHVMEQVSKMTCAKIVLCQAYDHMLETLQAGTSWSQYGFLKCITTSETQKKYISEIAVAAKHLLNLINEILDLSKIESGKEPWKFSEDFGQRLPNDHYLKKNHAHKMQKS